MAASLGIINLILAWLLFQSPWPAVIATPGEIISARSGAPVLEISAPRAAALAARESVYLFQKQAEESQPIASITKLMTALVFLENNPGWEKTYVISAADQVTGGRLNLFPGDELTIKDLFNTSLVASDNGATLALVHASGLSEADFVAQMNGQARRLGLRQTVFLDPTGLSDQNISTARDVARLALAAFRSPEIRTATARRDYRFRTINGQEKFVESTDYLLFSDAPEDFAVQAGKTGYTDRAGYCFVGLFADKSGREIISVVLNSPGKNERFRESQFLVHWVFSNYSW
jgi:D-alanyl-D-alanine endopeptidase (penicillin-binding protein 7)